MSARTTAIVVTYRSAGIIDQLCETLEGLRESCGIVLIDNDSPDDTLDLLRTRLPWAGPISAGSNRGFGSACNLGLSRVSTPYTLFLNHDARISGECLEMLEDRLDEKPSTAAVQPLIRAWGWPEVTASRGIGMTRFYEGFDLGFMRFEPWIPPTAIPAAGVTAALSLWRTSVLRDLDGFDPGIFMYFEDVDLCIRASLAGWGFEVLQGVSGEHMVGVSSDRSSAGAWELASSFRLAMKFSPRPARARWSFLKREARIFAAGIRRPGLSSRRAIALIGSMGRNRGGAGPAFIPQASSPADLPPARHAAPHSLDSAGVLVSGPGWTGHRSFKGFGAFTASGESRLTVGLRSSMPATGRIWSGGVPGGAFIACEQPGEFTFPLRAGRHYLAADDGEAAISIERLDLHA